MKNKRLNKHFGLLFLLAVSCQPAIAQKMNMHPHSRPSTNKNVFLVMMDTMMVKMDKAANKRSAEADFISQMIPHHEGAVAMAKYEIRHGRNFGMVQLAKSILAEQQSELQQMQLWLKQSPAHETPISIDFRKAMDQTMSVMMDQMPLNAMLNNTDRAFALVMIPHHQAAVDMARVVLKYASEQQTIAFAGLLISNEQVEIEQMSSYSK